MRRFKEVDGRPTSISVIDYTGTPEQQAIYRQLGVWCINAGRAALEEDAHILFEAWYQTVEDHDKWKSEQHFLIAMAHGGNPQWGIDRMNAILERDPDDELARVGVGLAMLIGGMEGWQEHVDVVLATSMDQYVRQTALRTITFVAANLRRVLGEQGNLRPS